MPSASPLPRKYLTRLQEAQEDLQLMAVRCRAAIQELGRTSPQLIATHSLLREVEATSYRLALSLAKIDVAAHCDDCPALSSMTSLQAFVLVLADDLDQHVAEIRRCIHPREG